MRVFRVLTTAAALLAVHAWPALAEAAVVSGQTYRLVTTCGAGTSLVTVSGLLATTAKVDSAALVIGAPTSSATQTFKIELVSGANYKLTNTNSGKVIEVPAWSTAAGVGLAQYAYNGGANQLFQIESPAVNVYRFKNVNSGLYMDLYNQDTTAGTIVEQYTTNTTCSQRFQLEAVAPTPATTELTIQKVISDMQTASELVPKYPQLAAFDWAQFPKSTQYSATKASIPNWFLASHASPDFMTYGTAWYVLMEGAGNTSTNTSVEVRNLRMYFLSNSTRTWMLFDSVTAPWTDMWTAPFNETSTKNVGNVLRPIGANFYHGYGSKKPLPNAADIRGTFAAIEFRLVRTNASQPDDTASARYTLDVGGDFWPSESYDWDYAPGIGNGRMLQATTSWQTATMWVPNTALGSSYPELNTYSPPLMAP